MTPSCAKDRRCCISFRVPGELLPSVDNGMHKPVLDILVGCGHLHTHISPFVKAHNECIHNLVYRAYWVRLKNIELYIFLHCCCVLHPPLFTCFDVGDETQIALILWQQTCTGLLDCFWLPLYSASPFTVRFMTEEKPGEISSSQFPPSSLPGRDCHCSVLINDVILTLTSSNPIRWSSL